MLYTEISWAQIWLLPQSIHSYWQFDAAANSVVTIHQAGRPSPPNALKAHAFAGTISSRPTARLQPLDTVTSCCTQGWVWSRSVSDHATCSSNLAKQLTVNLLCCLSQGLLHRNFPCKVLVLVSIKYNADAIVPLLTCLP